MRHRLAKEENSKKPVAYIVPVPFVVTDGGMSVAVCCYIFSSLKFLLSLQGVPSTTMPKSRPSTF